MSVATAFRLGGQDGWSHPAPDGTFHTYDRFAVGDQAPRKVHILVPPGTGPFPVVVMHDGDTAFWPGGVGRKTWDVAGTLAERRGRVRDVLIVAICPIDRNFEYTHVDWAHGQRPWGGLRAHAAWVAGPVKDWIDQHYPTTGPAAIAGSSHGALAAFWTATRHPERFRIAGCLSPSFFSGLDSLVRGSRPVPLELASLFADARPVLADPARRPKIWMCWGLRRDGGDHNAIVEHLASLRGAEMADLLVREGYRRQNFQAGDAPDPTADLFVHVDPPGGHDEDAWKHRFGLFMDAMFSVPG